MVVQHNLSSMNTNRQLNISDNIKAASSEKLASGYRINRAADDAAGLSISEKLRWQIRGLNTASRNISDGISLIQVADGALAESHAILQRMNELSVQAANDTNTSIDRAAIQSEINEITKELDRIATGTTFNGEIYPLYGKGIQLPDGIGVTDITVVNNSQGTVTCDGVVYNPGDTFTVKNVLSIMKAPDYSNMSEAAIYFSHNGGSGRGYTTSNIFTVDEISTTPPVNYDIKYSKLSDVKVDDNGYLYADSLSSSNSRFYMGQRQFVIVQNPTPANLDAAGIYKAGSADEPINIQAGSLSGQAVEIPLVDASAAALGVTSLDVTSFQSAGDAIDTIAGAIEKVSKYRSQFGAIQNRLEHSKSNVENTAENTQNAESRIRDTDIADEMVKFSTASIISQSAQSMLTQANQQPQGVLSLLSQ